MAFTLEQQLNHIAILEPASNTQLNITKVGSSENDTHTLPSAITSTPGIIT